MKLLKMQDVTYAFGDHVILNHLDIEFSLDAGCIFIKGKNGTGKTTLLNLLSETLRLQDGVYQREGISIAYSPFDDILYGHLTVLDNLRYYYRILMDKNFILAEQETLLKCMHIDYLQQKVKDCSSGERKKVSLMCLLQCKADVYILDEPFAALDEDTRNSLLLIINKMKKASLFIMTSHQEEGLFDIADKVYTLEGGTLRCLS